MQHSFFSFCSLIIIIIIIIIIPSLTLGSIYSTYVSGAEQMTEINNSNQTILIVKTGLRIRNWPEANQLAIYKPGRGFELGMTVTKSR